MSNADIRKAHKILDDLFKGNMVLDEEREFLRGALPELPKQKTLEEIHEEVDEAWLATNDPELKERLREISTQIRGLFYSSPNSPALPAGMRLAEHEKRGRVVVSLKPNDIGQYKIFHLDDSYVSGADVSYAEADALTFIDAEPALKPPFQAEPAHPEFLETEADYDDAPEGTIVACEDSSPWYKSGPEWSSVDFCGVKDDKGMSRARRRVLRWGDGK